MAVPVDAEALVLSHTQLSPDYSVLVLEAPAIAASARPGQFVMVRTSPGTDPLLRRPFSTFEILRGPARAPAAFSLLIKRIGPGTERLAAAAPGDRLACLGPLGRPFDLVAPGTAEAWMVAGGVGLAPFASLTEALRAQGTPITLFYGARTIRELFYLDWFASRGVGLELATEDGSRGAHGRVTVPLARALESAPADRAVMVYACGPESMLKAVVELASAHGRRSQVSMERIMGCGLGGCYSCVVQVRTGGEHGHYVRSCLDGPVFDGDQVVWG